MSKFAHVLRSYGVNKGDRVLIYMPMIPQAMIAMLATVRLGAIHSLVFGGFAAKELAVRIEHAEVTISSTKMTKSRFKYRKFPITTYTFNVHIC